VPGVVQLYALLSLCRRTRRTCIVGLPEFGLGLKSALKSVLLDSDLDLDLDLAGEWCCCRSFLSRIIRAMPTRDIDICPSVTLVYQNGLAYNHAKYVHML